MIGQQRGNLREIAVRLLPDIRDRLRAASEQTEKPAGALVIDACAANYEHITSSVPEPLPGGFVPQRTSRLSPGDQNRVQTTFLVVPENAVALESVAEAAGLSVSALVERCLDRGLPPLPAVG
jgi:hypothetical protein